MEIDKIHQLILTSNVRYIFSQFIKIHFVVFKVQFIVFLSYWYVLTYNKCTDIKCNLKLDCKCIVSDKAKVIYAPKEVYLPYGKQALLDCHFRANPPLTDLRWEKDGFLFDPYNVQGVFYRKNGSLYFSKVDETHAGSYTCTPYNELGTEGPSSPTIVVTTQLRSRKIVRQIGRPETIS